jgi:hypothetical protein
VIINIAREQKLHNQGQKNFRLAKTKSPKVLLQKVIIFLNLCTVNEKHHVLHRFKNMGLIFFLDWE